MRSARQHSSLAQSIEDRPHGLGGGRVRSSNGSEWAGVATNLDGFDQIPGSLTRFKMKFTCSDCRDQVTAAPNLWRCERCPRSPFELEPLPFRPDAIVADDHSLWRYRAMLPVDRSVRIVTLGEGMTPLVEATVAGMNVHFKLEFISPPAATPAQASPPTALAPVFWPGSSFQRAPQTQRSRRSRSLAQS